MENNNSVKVGQPIYLARMGSYDMHYCLATVVKVTPAGCIDVQIGTSPVMRFRPDGKRQGGTGYHDYQLDSMPFQERVDCLAAEARAATAAAVINRITIGKVTEKWSKEGMLNELARIQQLLNNAKLAVEAI